MTPSVDATAGAPTATPTHAAIRMTWRVVTRSGCRSRSHLSRARSGQRRCHDRGHSPVRRGLALGVSLVAHAVLLSGIVLALDDPEPDAPVAHAAPKPADDVMAVELVDEPKPVQVALAVPASSAAPRSAPERATAPTRATGEAIAASTTGTTGTMGSEPGTRGTGGTDLIGHMRGPERPDVGDILGKIADGGKPLPEPVRISGKAARQRQRHDEDRRRRHDGDGRHATATRTSTTSRRWTSTCFRRCRRPARSARTSARASRAGTQDPSTRTSATAPCRTYPSTSARSRARATTTAASAARRRTARATRRRRRRSRSSAGGSRSPTT